MGGLKLLVRMSYPRDNMQGYAEKMVLFSVAQRNMFRSRIEKG